MHAQLLQKRVLIRNETKIIWSFQSSIIFGKILDEKLLIHYILKFVSYGNNIIKRGSLKNESVHFKNILKLCIYKMCCKIYYSKSKFKVKGGWISRIFETIIRRRMITIFQITRGWFMMLPWYLWSSYFKRRRDTSCSSYSHSSSPR